MQKQGEEYWKFKQRTTRPIPTVEQTLQHTDLIDRMIGTNIYYFCPLTKNDSDYEFGKGEWLKGQITGKEELETGRWVHIISNEKCTHLRGFVIRSRELVLLPAC